MEVGVIGLCGVSVTHHVVEEADIKHAHVPIQRLLMVEAIVQEIQK